MRVANEDDVAAAARVLTEAFFDDPIQQWLFPDEERRRRRLRKAFEVELGHHFVGLAATMLAPPADERSPDPIASVAAWAPPNRWKLGGGAVARLLVAHRSLIGPRMPAAMRLLQGMDRRHPHEPHWYLGILGTHPSHQGHGYASTVLRGMLDRCDRDGIPAYLESSKEANVPFYERHGFRVTGTIDVDGPPPMWSMWRDPAT